MNKSTSSLFFALVSIHALKDASGFQIHSRSVTPSKLFVETDPFREIDIDIEIAEHCAANFGKFTVDEIEHCRDELHSRRVQHVALGDDTSGPDVMKEQLLEEELTLQLNWLKDEMPESYLFPEEGTFDFDVDTDMKLDGILMDNGLVAVDLPSSKDVETSNEAVVQNNNGALWKKLADEGVFEGVAICAFIAIVMIAPDFF